MKMSIAALMAVLVFTPIPVVANENSLSGLLERSDTVASVLILAGEITERQSIGCGITYEGIVVSSVKGADESELMKFRVRKSLYVGGTYFIFTTDEEKPLGTKDEVEGFLDMQSKNCSCEGVSATVTSIDDQVRYDAIFELRELSELAKDGDGPYYVGPIPAKEFFGANVESHALTIHSPEGSSFRIAINAKEFHESLMAIANQEQ